MFEGEYIIPIEAQKDIENNLHISKQYLKIESPFKSELVVPMGLDYERQAGDFLENLKRTKQQVNYGTYGNERHGILEAFVKLDDLYNSKEIQKQLGQGVKMPDFIGKIGSQVIIPLEVKSNPLFIREGVHQIAIANLALLYTNLPRISARLFNTPQLTGRYKKAVFASGKYLLPDTVTNREFLDPTFHGLYDEYRIYSIAIFNGIRRERSMLSTSTNTMLFPATRYQPQMHEHILEIANLVNVTSLHDVVRFVQMRTVNYVGDQYVSIPRHVDEVIFNTIINIALHPGMKNSSPLELSNHLYAQDILSIPQLIEYAAGIRTKAFEK